MMKNFKRTALAYVVNLALFGVPAAQASDTAALERRIRELEVRLEKLDYAAAQADKPVTASPEVEKLTRKVNTLERKLEVQDEVTASTFKKLPVFDAGPDGFRISSSDKKHQVRVRGAIQADARFFSEDASHRSTDSFDLKQARVWLEGYVFNTIYYKIMPDFAASGNILPDAYIDYAYDPAVSLLVGKLNPRSVLNAYRATQTAPFWNGPSPPIWQATVTLAYKCMVPSPNPAIQRRLCLAR